MLLLLFDPIVTPFSDLAPRAKHLLNKPNTILVLTSGSISDLHCQSVSKTLSSLGCQPGHILFVNPRQALDAVDTLQANPTLPSAIDRYQRDSLDSRISTITTAINEILSAESPSRTSLMHLRRKSVLWQVQGSLSASFRSVEATKKDVELVAGRISDLSSEVQRIRDNARHDILGESGETNQTEGALSLGMKKMNALLGSLTFWKMIWRVDEIGSLVSAAVQAQWCKGLENQVRSVWVKLVNGSHIHCETSSFYIPDASNPPRDSYLFPRSILFLLPQRTLFVHPSLKTNCNNCSVYLLTFSRQTV